MAAATTYVPCAVRRCSRPARSTMCHWCWLEVPWSLRRMVLKMLRQKHDHPDEPGAVGAWESASAAAAGSVIRR